MLDVERDGYFQHVVPMHLAFRIMLVIFGAFAIIAATLSLWRGVWPLNITSPFFLMLIVGACAVGGPMALAGITAPSVRWTVERDRVRILLTSPFGEKTVDLRRSDIAAFEIREYEEEDANTWAVELLTHGGQRFPSRRFGSKAYAEGIRTKMLAAFDA